MKTIIGRLTQGNKKAIKAILNAGRQSGKVGNTNYFLIEDKDRYIVKIIKMDRGLGFIGSEIRQSVYKCTFKL